MSALEEKNLARMVLGTKERFKILRGIFEQNELAFSEFVVIFQQDGENPPQRKYGILTKNIELASEIVSKLPWCSFEEIPAEKCHLPEIEKQKHWPVDVRKK